MSKTKDKINELEKEINSLKKQLWALDYKCKILPYSKELKFIKNIDEEDWLYPFEVIYKIMDYLKIRISKPEPQGLQVVKLDE